VNLKMGKYEPILKPKDREGLVSLTPKERRKIRFELFNEQHGICACGCGQRMTLIQYQYNSVTLEHKKVQPMGHKKDDRRENLCATRWECNAKKGSKPL
jgi:hypothetical protein